MIDTTGELIVSFNLSLIYNGILFKQLLQLNLSTMDTLGTEETIEMWPL